MNNTTITRHIKVELSTDEELNIIRKWIKQNKSVVTILLENPKGHCPFPDECSCFPCNTLSCNSDVCSNGYAYRMS